MTFTIKEYFSFVVMNVLENSNIKSKTNKYRRQF